MASSTAPEAFPRTPFANCSRGSQWFPRRPPHWPAQSLIVCDYHFPRLLVSASDRSRERSCVLPACCGTAALAVGNSERLGVVALSGSRTGDAPHTHTHTQEFDAARGITRAAQYSMASSASARKGWQRPARQPALFVSRRAAGGPVRLFSPFSFSANQVMNTRLQSPPAVTFRYSYSEGPPLLLISSLNTETRVARYCPARVVAHTSSLKFSHARATKGDARARGRCKLKLGNLFVLSNPSTTTTTTTRSVVAAWAKDGEWARLIAQRGLPPKKPFAARPSGTNKP